MKINRTYKTMSGSFLVEFAIIFSTFAVGIYLMKSVALALLDYVYLMHTFYIIYPFP